MKALITGISGQDGSYLAEFLLGKGYEVVGLYRRSSSPNFSRIEHIKDKITLVEGDITDASFLYSFIPGQFFDEIYNLAAQSHVQTSFTQPLYTTMVDYVGCLNILEVLALLERVPTRKKCKFYQASTSEMFGTSVNNGIQNENTPFNPQSPYAIAKLAAHHGVRLYRDSYGVFGCCGILFNHESPRRGDEFVTKKITNYVKKIKWMPSAYTLPPLKLGNLDASRDWGFAGDYCIDYNVPILTTNGWKFRNELNIGDEIINFNKVNNSLSIDTIKDIYDTQSNGNRYNFLGQGVDFKCTENHRIYYQTKSKKSKGGWSDWKVCTAKELFDKFKDLKLRSKYDYRFPSFQNYKQKEYNISDDKIYLLGCLLAEGSLDSEYGNGIKVSLSQSYIVNEKIHQKIEDCIQSLDLVANKHNKNNGVTEWKFSAESSKEILEWFDLPNIHIAPKYIYQFNQRQSRILFDSLMDCDGCWGSMSYSSRRYLLAADFQTITHLAGLRTSQITDNNGQYVVQIICKNKPYVYVQNIELLKNCSENVWCINTNNGTIITRDNDCLFISGNCEGMWLMLQQDKPDDYILATGKTYTVRDFLNEAFHNIGIYDWSPFVEIDDKFKRPAEVPYLCGDASKAREKLGWVPKTDFRGLVKMMVEN